MTTTAADNRGVNGINVH